MSESGNVLTVTYERNHSEHQTTYTLADQQPNTHFAVRSDGHGGTDIVLATGVQHLHHGEFLL